MMKARKVFDGQCVPPSFKPVTGGGGGGGKGASTGSPVHKLSVSSGGIRSSGRFSGKWVTFLFLFLFLICLHFSLTLSFPTGHRDTVPSTPVQGVRA